MLITNAFEADLDQCAVCFLHSEVARRYEYARPLVNAQLAEAIVRGELWVAKAKGVVLGYAWIALSGAFYSDPYLRGIAVREDCRSEGIGSQLLEFFELKAFAVSIRAFLLVGDYNLRAQQFYLSKGYSEVGRIPDFSNIGITELIMLKRKTAATPIPEGSVERSRHRTLDEQARHE